MFFLPEGNVAWFGYLVGCVFLSEGGQFNNSDDFFRVFGHATSSVDYMLPSTVPPKKGSFSMRFVEFISSVS